MLLFMTSTNLSAQAVHRIEAGETLTSIAHDYGISTEDIKNANPEANGHFYAGMKIKIPAMVKHESQPVQSQLVDMRKQETVRKKRVKHAPTADNEVLEHRYYGVRKGGFSVAFGADPIINFVGNMFNNTANQHFQGFEDEGNNCLGTDLFKGTTISGKYMLQDDLALNIGVGFNNSATKQYTYDYEGDKMTQVETKGTHQFMAIVGAQKLLRPGKRLQPILGLNIAYCYANNDYERTDVKTNDSQSSYTGHPAHTIGLLANVGVEYFLTKKISLSATLDLGLCKTFESSSNKKKSNKTKSSYLLKTGQFGNSIALNFYF